MTTIVLAGAALAITATLCWTALKAWRGWLDLRRDELAAKRERREAPETPPAARIEIADLRERLRKLEAIARGVDL